MSMFLWVCKSHEGLRDYNEDVTKTVAIIYISDVDWHVHGTQLKRTQNKHKWYNHAVQRLVKIQEVKGEMNDGLQYGNAKQILFLALSMASTD
jgi:hypothetical protein